MNETMLSWRRWRRATAWLVAGIACAVLTRADAAIMGALGPYLPAGHFWWLDGCRTLGEFPCLLAAAVLIWLFDRRRPIAVARFALAVGLALGMVSLGKLMLARERPPNRNRIAAASLHDSSRLRFDPSLSRAVSDARHASFPSGHTACVFAATVVLAGAFPRWRVPLLAAATACAVSRVLQTAHWPSDVSMGALVGSAAARASVWLTGGASALGRLRLRSFFRAEVHVPQPP